MRTLIDTLPPDVRFVSSTGVVWRRGTVLGLASSTCRECAGRGGLPTDVPTDFLICGCVYRRTFTACASRYARIRTSQANGTTSVIQERTQCVRNEENYLVDFEKVSQKTLHPLDWPLFRHFVVGGYSPSEVRAAFHLPEDVFWERVRDFQELLGRVYHELEPFPLHPTGEYFGTHKKVKAIGDKWRPA